MDWFENCPLANMGWTRPIDSEATPSVRFAATGVQDLAVIPRRSSLCYDVQRRVPNPEGRSVTASGRQCATALQGESGGSGG